MTTLGKATRPRQEIEQDLERHEQSARELFSSLNDAMKVVGARPRGTAALLRRYDDHAQREDEELNEYGRECAAELQRITDRVRLVVRSSFDHSTATELLALLSRSAFLISGGPGGRVRDAHRETRDFLNTLGRIVDRLDYIEYPGEAPDAVPRSEPEIPVRVPVPLPVAVTEHPAIRSTEEAATESGTTADVLLVVATPAELAAVLEEAKTRAGAGFSFDLHHGERRTYYDLGEIEGARVMVLQVEMGSGTPGGSITSVLDAQKELQPSSVLMVGIAFGVDPEKQPIGTVLVSKSISQYEIQRVGTTDGQEPAVVSRGDTASASTKLLSRIRAACTAENLEIDPGRLLSGEKLIDNLDFRQALLKLEPEAIGGDMEGSGLYTAASESKTDWIVIKAVCDYADGQKRHDKAKRQATAAAAAAKVAFATLYAGGLDK